MKRASGRKRDLRSACIFGDSTGDGDADRILMALCGTPEGLTRSQIRRSVFGDNQPAEAIAARLEFAKAGEVIPLRNLTPEILRARMNHILKTGAYREGAARVAASIRDAGGVNRAADLVEDAFL